MGWQRKICKQRAVWMKLNVSIERSLSGISDMEIIRWWVFFRSKFPELTGDPEQLRKMKHIGFQAWIKPAVPRFRSCSSFNMQLHNIDLQKKLIRCSNVLFVFPTQLQMLIIKSVPWQPVTINTAKSINNSDATARTSTTWKTCNSSKLQAFERRWRLKTKRTELKTQNISRANEVARRSERNPRARVIIPLRLFPRVCENKANCKVILHYFIGFGRWGLDFFPSLCACTNIFKNLRKTTTFLNNIL
jgi:hypothetical protein